MLADGTDATIDHANRATGDSVLTRRQLLLGCAGAAAATACRNRRPATVDQQPPPPSPDQLLAWLADDTVYYDDFARIIFYTWTRPDQIAALGQRHQLLTRERGSDGSRSLYDRSLDRVASRDGGIARLLQRPSFRRKRFAWANLWATRRGWNGADYGDHLIKVTLEADAAIGRFDPGSERPWRFESLNGPISLDEIRARPERIGAIYHHFVPPPGDETPPFREYVLCNEAQIVRYQVATREISRDVSWSVDSLTLLHRYISATADPLDGCDSVAEWRKQVASDWRQRPAPLSPRSYGATTAPVHGYYHRALAFASELVRPTAANVAGLIAALRELPQVNLLDGRPQQDRPPADPGYRDDDVRCADPTMCPPPPKRPCNDPTFCP